MQSGRTPDNAEAITPASRRSNPDLLRRVAITLTILALYQLGRFIPATGINAEFSFAANGANPAYAFDLTPTLSHFALGVTPLFSLLLLAEVFKLAFSDVRGWAMESRRTRYLGNKVLTVAALMLAAFQAYGLSTGLEALQSGYGVRETLPLLEPGGSFRMTYVASIVTGTALAIWLADQITRHGVGSGFWFLFLLPSLLTLAMTPTRMLSHLAIGDVSTASVVALLAVLAASAAAVVILTRQWIALAPAGADFDNASDSARVVLWPSFIAASAMGLIAALLNFLIADGDGSGQLLQRGSLGSALGSAAVIAILTYAMANGMLANETRLRRETHRLLALTAVTAAITCIAIDVLAAHLVPFGISGPVWIAILAVFALLAPRDIGAYLAPRSPSPGLDSVDS